MQHSPVYAPVVHQSDASRPSLGFPLGTALLLIVIFSLSGIFSCCYHWDKFRSLRRSYAHDLEAPDDHSDLAKPNLNYVKQENKMESFPVIMAGDKIAKFIALPCPCEPPRLEKHVPISTPQMPNKSLRLPIPLY